MRRSVYLAILFVIFFIHALLHIGIYKLTELNVQFLDQYTFYQYIETQGNVLKSAFPPGETISQFLLIAEVLLIIVCVFIASKRKKVQPLIQQNTLPPEHHARIVNQIDTDIDKLYDVLKQKKKMKLSEIAKTYKVSNETALEWGRTLEIGKLASLSYPRFSEPTLVLKEESTKEKSKK